MVHRSNWGKFAVLALAPWSASLPANAAPVRASVVLIPLPASIAPIEGRYVPGRRLVVALTAGRDKGLRQLAVQAAAMLGTAWHRPAGVVSGPGPAGAIRLNLTSGAADAPESYHLEVTPSGVELSAHSAAGLFYGLQTLRQLAEQGDSIDAARIDDAPRFRWRGLMLDSGRHMMPVSYIKRQLDLMARYKFNVLHWHLTDDQGWRLEIKRYPRLTKVGAWREETVLGHQLDPYVGDGKRYGGFYTQAQVREVVAYAHARHIEVVPEIDMPGHMVAALASYPKLGCTPGPFKVRTTWGVADDVLCPTPTTLKFVENVLTEVMQLFPSRYIHLGGDEAPTVRWEHSPFVQALMKRKHLASEHAVQGWFLRQVETFVEAHGRKVIGWDEILDGRPSPSATIMSWRGMSGGIAAAKLGHDVIMTPTDYAYLDYCQGDPAHEPICNPNSLPFRRVYDFEPVPPALTGAEARHVIGGQGNLWTEYLATPKAVEYMLWPRSLAMAEVLWSPKDSRDWGSFTKRLPAQLASLDKLGVNYRIPEVAGLEHDVLSLRPKAVLTLRTLLPNAVIRYTLDGSEPGPQSRLYQAPVALPLTAKGSLVTARAFVGGRAGPVTSARFKLTSLQPATDTPATKRGLRQRYFEAEVESVKALDGLAATRADTATEIAIPTYARPESFGLVFDGFIRVPTNGIYTFALRSDDGSDLNIGGETVVGRDGPQSPGETSGSIALAAGAHRFVLRYFQGGGGKALHLTVARDGKAPHEVPADWWRQP